MLSLGPDNMFFVATQVTRIKEQDIPQSIYIFNGNVKKIKTIKMNNMRLKTNSNSILTNYFLLRNHISIKNE